MAEASAAFLGNTFFAPTPFFAPASALGPTPIRPDQVTSTTLVLWLNAFTGVTVTGSGVSTWEDQSPSNADFVQTSDPARPLYGESYGRPCVTSDANRFMTTPAIAAHQISASNYLYVFVSFRSLEMFAGRGLIGRYQTQFEWGLNVTAAGFTDRISMVVGVVPLLNGGVVSTDGELKVAWGEYSSSSTPGAIVNSITDLTGGGDINAGTAPAIPVVGVNPTFLGRYNPGVAGSTTDFYEVHMYKSTTRMSNSDLNGLLAYSLNTWAPPS